MGVVERLGRRPSRVTSAHWTIFTLRSSGPTSPNRALRTKADTDVSKSITASALGGLPDGRAVVRYALRNAHGLTAEVMNYGATLTALRTPDRNGRFENITLGFDTLDPYVAGVQYFGATVGRCANRIAGARFALDGARYALTANEGRHHLHGGSNGFDRALWRACIDDDGRAQVRFSHVSADGDQGYPGELTVDVTYALSDDDRLSIEYSATTTKATHVNLTHHSYFNLSGAALDEVTGHELSVDADRVTPVDAELIPTGELRDVGKTPFDFRSPRAIGACIGDDDDQLRFAGGYDHNFVLNKPSPGALTRAAALSDPVSGRVLEVWTTEPGLQFYSGNFLDGSLVGPNGPFPRRSGLCLEPQHFPNAPNQPRFPSTILRPGEAYRSRTEFRLSVQD
jgi:aldose 1-epimerase